MNTTQSRLLRLYLIRHAETEWSRSGQHTGDTDIPLTESGETAAAEVGQRLRNIPFTRVLSSPRQRTRRTYELTRLTPTVEIEPGLAEWNYGDYEAKRTVDIHAERPDWNIFKHGCPGGESPAQVSDRADRLITHLGTLEGNVALFTHGHFGCVLATRWIGLPVIECQHFSLDPASVSILGYSSRLPVVPVISLWNAGPVSISEGARSLSRTGHLGRK